MLTRPGVVVTGVLVVVALTGCDDADDGDSPSTGDAGSSFESARWIDADPFDPDDQTRCQLVDDLDGVLIAGTSRDDVRDLLGIGVERDDGTEVWSVGACGLSIDPGQVLVTFDDDDGLVEWRQVQG